MEDGGELVGKARTCSTEVLCAVNDPSTSVYIGRGRRNHRREGIDPVTNNHCFVSCMSHALPGG